MCMHMCIYYKLFKNFKFIEKLQRQFIEFMYITFSYTPHPVSPVVNIIYLIVVPCHSDGTNVDIYFK